MQIVTFVIQHRNAWQIVLLGSQKVFRSIHNSTMHHTSTFWSSYKRIYIYAVRFCWVTFANWFCCTSHHPRVQRLVRKPRKACRRKLSQNSKLTREQIESFFGHNVLRTTLLDNYIRQCWPNMQRRIPRKSPWCCCPRKHKRFFISHPI